MIFIADAMLGRLARWLRLMGYDTLYIRDVEDHELLRRARAGGRTILTRDTDFLHAENPAGCLLIEHDGHEEQLAQVVKAFGLVARPGTRCANCNYPLEHVKNNPDIRDSVPVHIYLSHTVFLLCTGCGNVYWEGTQKRDIERVIQRAARAAREGGR